VYSSQMMAVYTGFAIILTTLIWVYVSWLILLIGAQLAFYLQFPQYLRIGQDLVELSGNAREQAGLSVMALIGRDYTDGKGYWSSNALAAKLDIPSTALAPVLASLERGGLILATEKEQFVPARDVAGIRVIDIIEAVRSRQTGRLQLDMQSQPCASEIMQEVDDAIRDKLSARSLKDLIAASEPRTVPASDAVLGPEESTETG
jgi:membrane protein